MSRMKNVHSMAKKSGKKCTITEEYIESIWPEDGCCPGCRHRMVLEPFFDGAGLSTMQLRWCQASLGRIDYDIGYIKGNVEWLCHECNRAKQDLPDNEGYRLIGIGNLMTQQYIVRDKGDLKDNKGFRLIGMGNHMTQRWLAKERRLAKQPSSHRSTTSMSEVELRGFSQAVEAAAEMPAAGASAEAEVSSEEVTSP